MVADYKSAVSKIRRQSFFCRNKVSLAEIREYGCGAKDIFIVFADTM
jgi:hypothetical protein